LQYKNHFGASLLISIESALVWSVGERANRHTHTQRETAVGLLTGRKGVWSLRCLLSSPEGAADRQECLHTQILRQNHESRLQTPAVQRHRERW